MRHALALRTTALLALASALTAAACDSARDDDALATTTAPWTYEVYDPPIHDEKSGGDVTWAIDFESRDDVDKLASELQCKDSDAPDVCAAVDPAYAVFDGFDPKSGTSSLTICRTVGGRRPWGHGSCTTCCTFGEGDHVATCRTTCTQPPPVLE